MGRRPGDGRCPAGIVGAVIDTGPTPAAGDEPVPTGAGRGRPGSAELPVRLAGLVIEGDRRGRELGFPTANVAVPGEERLPPDGVFAGWLRRDDGSVHIAAISIGTRPTFYGPQGERLIEAYLLDFDGDLYGEQVQVGVEAAVRGQLSFASVGELVDSMRRDVEAVRLLAAAAADWAGT
jgi:FAD synthase